MPQQSLAIYQVDAFASSVFSGNPAAICVLEQWLPDDTMQAIAEENNLAETAFLVADDAPGAYAIRWFTPSVEVPLCGHATLAAAHVLFEHLGEKAELLRFSSKGGDLTVSRSGERYALALPAFAAESVAIDPSLANAVGGNATAQYQGNYPMLLLPNQAAVENATPDFPGIAAATVLGCLVITAPGDDCDFVSRFFGPGVGIDEDPVTGSAHCLLAPFWSQQLGKTTMQAKQLSPRGGELGCVVESDHVELLGQCVTYLIGEIFLSD